MNAILHVENLTKQYADFKLDHVSFSVPKGTIMGLIGENGAGKSTTINAILDLIHKDDGTVTFWGQELSSTKQIKEDVGVVFDGINFYETLTPAKVGKIAGAAYKQWDGHLFQDYLKRFQLPADKEIKSLSKGMKMKLCIAVALSHNPKLLILDEATSGLDPVMRDDILDVFLEFVAKDLAREVGYIYIDSGAMYRAVTLYSIENGIFNGDVIDTEKLKEAIRDIRITFRPNPETGRPDTYLNGVNVENKIRTMGVSSKVSPISALDFVREAMVAQQQAMGKEKGIVMDGRDIGTTVFPDAELKIFVTATPEIRAQRRFDELKAKGQEGSFEEILENVKQRDYIDQHREVSPLRKADDALLLDNSNLSIEQQKEWLSEQFGKVVKE